MVPRVRAGKGLDGMAAGGARGHAVIGHGVIFYYASSHLALSAGLVSGVVLLIVIKHLGWLGPTYALLESAGADADALSQPSQDSKE